MKNTSSCTKAARAAKLIALLACMALLAGCGDGGQAVPTDSPAPAPTATPAETAPKPGGSLTLPMQDGAEIGNPLKPATREMSSIYGLIFESLLVFDDTGALAPCLAEKWPSSTDNLKCTFKLRSGVKWQGTGRRELNAGDVVFTLNEIKSLGKDNPWGYVTDYLKSWKANDDGTLTIELKTPFYGAMQALTFPVLPSDGGYNNGGAPATPMGTGPYQYVSSDKGKSITLQANPDWWKQPPYISDITVKGYPDNATEISSLVLRDLSAMQTDDLTVTQYKESGDANVYEYPTRYFEFMALNFTSPDLKNKLIRQAIAYAIDRREVVSYTYVNHAIVSDTPVPPDSWLYDGKLLQYNSDVEQAKQLIRLAGWQDNLNGTVSGSDGYWDTSPDGAKRDLKFTLLANRDDNNTLRNDAATLMAGQLDKAGIKVEVDAEPWDKYSQMIKEGRFDLALCGCYLSPVPDYKFLLGTGGAMNVGGYTSTDMDKLLDDISKASDSTSLKVKIGSLQSLVIEDLPIISLYFRTHTLLTTPDLQGVAGAREDSAFAEISQWYISK